MNDPLPLPEDIGSRLPSPLFTPRPGWGGQLSRFFQRNASTLGTLTMITAIIILLVVITWTRLPARQSSLKSNAPVTMAQDANITLAALPGDGIHALAVRAMDLYCISSESRVSLSSAQRIAASTRLATSVSTHPLRISDTITFSAKALDDALKYAQSLTPTQEAAWQRYLSK